MTPLVTSRRRFLVGCSAAVAAMAGARLTAVVGAAADTPESLLVLVALRGGWDGLSVLSPLGGNDRRYYEAARPTLKIPSGGPEGAIRLSDQFGLHPAMAPLGELYQARKLALIHAAGLTTDTRSHFDAMEFIELGTPGAKSIGSGWLTRYLQSSGASPKPTGLPLVAVGAPPTSMLGSPQAVAVPSVDGFTISSDDAQRAAQEPALRALYGGRGWLEDAGSRTMDAATLIAGTSSRAYEPANHASYPSTETGTAFKTLAQLVKLNVGVQIATIDVGGWDTHDNQGNGSGGYLARPLADLARALQAFYVDLDSSGRDNVTDRLVVVLQSEFGRRVAENSSRGTDHGHGSVMGVLGGRVNGGRIFGAWPGLARDQLFEGEDLAVTTDYRQVLAEVLVKRLGTPQLLDVFPGFVDYRPLGIL
jgi:uncharacterized protein (DUF1501 family)